MVPHNEHINDGCDDDQISSSNESYTNDNDVSTECCSSTFASSQSTVMINEGSSDDDMPDAGRDEEKKVFAAFLPSNANSEDGSYESYPYEHPPSRKCCNCEY